MDETEKVMKYEPLIQTTVRYWRDSIPPEYSDEDIAQELRIKVITALRSYDPDHPKAIPEERHVFGALRNRIKDMQKKSWRKHETLTDVMPGEILNRSIPQPWPTTRKIIGSGLVEAQFSLLPKNGNGRFIDEYDALVIVDHLSGLQDDEIQVAILVSCGYTASQAASIMGITVWMFRTRLEAVKEHLENLRVQVQS